jgi:hypothetical protein
LVSEIEHEALKPVFLAFVHIVHLTRSTTEIMIRNNIKFVKFESNKGMGQIGVKSMKKQQKCTENVSLRYSQNSGWSIILKWKKWKEVLRQQGASQELTLPCMKVLLEIITQTISTKRKIRGFLLKMSLKLK